MTVTINTIATASENKLIGCLTLDKPKALNALDLSMLETIKKQLDEWRVNEDIVAVWLQSSHEKAFCAGGDIISLYNGMKSIGKNPDAVKDDIFRCVPAKLSQFFLLEYEIDYIIHNYPKPLIAWGNGIIMGGGMGLFAGAQFKVVTEQSKLAMPEIGIGLFPDVGASYFLNKLPPGVGNFLALTGCQINGRDALDIGLASFLIDNELSEEIKKEISQIATVNERAISETLCTFESRSKMVTELKGLMSKSFNYSNIEDTSNRKAIYLQLQTSFEDIKNDKWLDKAKQTFVTSSPLSKAITCKQLALGRHKELAECFQMEASMAMYSLVAGEFQEGIRALLIDKDKQPNWTVRLDEEVTDEMVEPFFSVYRDKAHPLAGLKQ